MGSPGWNELYYWSFALHSYRQHCATITLVRGSTLMETNWISRVKLIISHLVTVAKYPNYTHTTPPLSRSLSPSVRTIETCNSLGPATHWDLQPARSHFRHAACKLGHFFYQREKIKAKTSSLAEIFFMTLKILKSFASTYSNHAGGVWCDSLYWVILSEICAILVLDMSGCVWRCYD